MAARSGSLPSESTPTYTSARGLAESVFFTSAAMTAAAVARLGNTYDGFPYVLSSNNRSMGARVKQRGTRSSRLFVESRGVRVPRPPRSSAYPNGLVSFPHQSSRRQSPVWNTRPHAPSNRNATLPGQWPASSAVTVKNSSFLSFSSSSVAVAVGSSVAATVLFSFTTRLGLADAVRSGSLSVTAALGASVSTRTSRRVASRGNLRNKSALVTAEQYTVRPSGSHASDRPHRWSACACVRNTAPTHGLRPQ